MSVERVQAVLDAFAGRLRGEPSNYLELYRSLAPDERDRVDELMVAEGEVDGVIRDEIFEAAVQEWRRQRGADE